MQITHKRKAYENTILHSLRPLDLKSTKQSSTSPFVGLYVSQWLQLYINPNACVNCLYAIQ